MFEKRAFDIAFDEQPSDGSLPVDFMDMVRQLSAMDEWVW